MEDARKKEILDKLAEAVVEFEEDQAREWAQIALDEGMDAFEAIMQGLAAGMETVGELYDQQEYFVPELLMSADALYAGLDILKPHIKADEMKKMGQVVIGTVRAMYMISVKILLNSCLKSADLRFMIWAAMFPWKILWKSSLKPMLKLWPCRR